ncbi:O-methyltransferase- family 2 [Apiospora rasikravindrae]|uniref:O-methyltransferase- family 2 n=1 Tax=Apiospora rasikravindrae TaxID=990691 RepID=A0ABR1UCG5_9PEZI
MSSPSSIERMEQLSALISDKTKLLTDFLASKGLDAPSFSLDELADLPVSSDDNKPFKARSELIKATRELHDIVLGPRESLRALAWGSTDQLSLQAIWEFKIAEAVPAIGSITFDELSVKIEECAGETILPFQLRTLLRHAMTNQVFCEPQKGTVAHTQMSRLLTSSPKSNAWVGFLTSDLFPAFANAVDAMKRWPASQEPSETGVNIAYSQDLPFYDFVQLDKGRAMRYSRAIESHGSSEGTEISHGVVDGYPWASLGDATVVDLLNNVHGQMGGNMGYVSVAIAEAFPRLKFVVQDTKGMRSAETLASVPQRLRDRIELTIHDFFDVQPVVAEVYLFRHVFHSFTDKYSIQILQSLVPALRKGARILINDGVLPEPGTLSYINERRIRTLDVVMLTVTNSRERELDDWKDLFRDADPRYKFLGAWKPTRSQLWFIEAEWDP